jgi:hypothetical protein
MQLKKYKNGIEVEKEKGKGQKQVVKFSQKFGENKLEK